MKKEYLSPTVEQVPLYVEQAICSTSNQDFILKDDEYFDSDSD